MDIAQNMQKKALAGNTCTQALKLFAFVFMLIDHTGVVFFPGVQIFRLLGRIALPLYAWCMVVGAEYTRNIWLYVLRILCVGVIAQPFYMLALNHSLSELNIFATLALGLLGIASIREKRFGSHIWGPLLALVLSCAIKMDYGWKGVLFIMLLYLSRKEQGTIIACMVSYCLFWGQSGQSVTNILGVTLRFSAKSLWATRQNAMLDSFFKLQGMAVLATPLMLVPMTCSFRLPKWAGYALYPAHLLVLYLLKLCLPV